MRGTIALVLVLIQSLLFWIAWTGDSALYHKKFEAVEAEIKAVEHRCDSLEVAIHALECIEGDTIIVNVPRPIVKIVEVMK